LPWARPLPVWARAVRRRFPSINTLLGILPASRVRAAVLAASQHPGALVGALIMGQAEALTMGYISTPMRDAVAFSILIIVLLVRPTGTLRAGKEKA